MTFNELNLIAPILDAVRHEGYEQPTPIQAQAIPHILDGRDLLGCARTGTGKTAAFAIPILQRMSHPSYVGNNQIKTLILTPTRELAIQINESFAAYGQNLRVKHSVIFGGVSQVNQVKEIKNGCDVLIATPGRLLDLMAQKLVSIAHIDTFVLDEADRMLDMGFIHDVRKVVSKLPLQRQTLFFSATMPPEIQKLANSILHNAVEVVVTPVSSTAELIGQQVYFVAKNDKRKLLTYLLKEQIKKRVLVFARTKHGADRIAKELAKAGIKAGAIHGNKSQNARQRALNDFKAGDLRVLVATDIAARGIDIDELPQVINYDLPEVAETYVHRIGRTGRAGASGAAISFCDSEERDYLKQIERLIGKKIELVEKHPFVEGDGIVQIRLPKNKEVVLRPDAVYSKPTGKKNNQAKSFKPRNTQPNTKTRSAAGVQKPAQSPKR
jgi:ATP-dependent RNA helicase RhlE